MSSYDAQLQERIDEATLRLMYSPRVSDRRKAMDELRELKKQQRPERIKELEQQMGLLP